MPKCPICHAEFSSKKLLSIHQKYCGRKQDPSDSDANFSTERIHRSDILGAIADTPPQVPPEPPPRSSPSAPSPPPRHHDTVVDPDLSPLHVATGLDTDATETHSKLNLELSDLYEDSRGRLKLSVKSFEGLLLVKASGELVVWTSLQLGSAFKKLLAAGGKSVIIEVSDVTTCDATGLGTLLLFHQELRELGSRLALSAPIDRQRKFECIKGFTRAIEFFTTLEAAVKSFSAAPKQ